MASFAAVTAVSLALSGMLQPARADAFDDIKARGKIIVAIDPTFAPFEFTDSSGKIVGYDPDILEAIAADWGVTIEYQTMAFPGIIPSIVAGSVDMEASALNVSAERAKKIDFTIPLASTTNAVLKLQDNTKVKSSRIEDLAGLKCAVKQTTQPEQMMQALNEELKGKGAQPVELMSFDTVEQTVAALADKRIDCVVDDKIVLAQAMQARANVPMEIVGEIGSKAFIAWGLNKNNPKLTSALNEGIQKLKKSGKLAELQKKHFGFTIDDLPESNYIPAE
jgi:polar amino acid transport system substrate-binding protein